MVRRLARRRSRPLARNVASWHDRTRAPRPLAFNKQRSTPPSSYVASEGPAHREDQLEAADAAELRSRRKAIVSLAIQGTALASALVELAIRLLEVAHG
jgi:hypothetical protein